MSGYILLVATNEAAQQVLPLFRVEETTAVELSESRTLLYVTNSGNIDRGALFQGYAIDHEAERMIFKGAAPSDVPDPSAPVEGSYFTARFDQDTVRCSTDSYGFVPQVWFSEPSITAVSDSFLSLVAIRRALNLPCTVHEETVAGRMWLNSMSFQQMGRETYCEQVGYSTPGSELSVDVRTGALTETPLNLLSFYQASFDTHAEAVTLAAERMVRTFKTYAETGGVVSLGLSGGTDSRVCLAAAMQAGVLDSMHIASTNNGTPDYDVAVSLSERFGFALNQSYSNTHGRLRDIDQAASWAASSLGIYDALYMPPKFRERDIPAFGVGGQGAEISKGNFGWRPLSNINMPAEALDQAQRALVAIGIDPDDRWGSEWHYLAFRNAIHGGRGSVSSDYIARPPAQIPLIGLSRSPLNQLPAPTKSKPSIVLDTLIKLNPFMATHRFDDPRKNPDPAYVEARIGELDGPLNSETLAPYSISGAGAPSAGLLSSHLDVAQSFGFTGALDPKSLIPRAMESMALHDRLVSDVVRDHVGALNRRSSTRIPAASRGAGAVGKLLGLSVLDPA